MKQFKTIKYLVFICSILALSYLLPQLWNISTASATRYPFAYYSSVDNSFMYYDYTQKPFKYLSSKGSSYTKDDFDSLLPMYYYRQLAVDGRLPDSLYGMETSPKTIYHNSFFFNYRPNDHDAPTIPLYTLYESFSGKVDLTPPGDFFRLTESGVEFIDPETNELIPDKSLEFSTVLQKLGYLGPAKITAGTPTTRKAYDEGYFIIDQSNKLFHLKMVNGKPFVTKTTLPEGMTVKNIFTTEYPDRRFYGFLIDQENQLYYIAANSYNLVDIPCPTFSYETDNLRIMANMFYWNISVTGNSGNTVYAVTADSMAVVDSISFPKANKALYEFSKYVFPFQLEFLSSNSKFVKPILKCSGLYFIILNILLLGIRITIDRLKKKKLSVFTIITIAITGIYGFITSFIIDLNKY